MRSNLRATCSRPRVSNTYSAITDCTSTRKIVNRLKVVTMSLSVRLAARGTIAETSALLLTEAK